MIIIKLIFFCRNWLKCKQQKHFLSSITVKVSQVDIYYSGIMVHYYLVHTLHIIGMVDHSLTSLNWLPEFQIPSIDKFVGQPPKDSASSSGESVFENGDEKSDRPNEELLLPLSPLKRCMNQTAEFEQNRWKYQHDPSKPPFSYTTIIYLAIRSSKNDKVTLGEIYQWIKDHFMYYRVAESTWQV